MGVNLNYAQIYDGKVEAVCVGDNWEDVNATARCAFGEDAFAIDVTYCPVRRGDFYHDGAFWRVDEETGEEIQLNYMPTPEQQLEELESKTNELVEYQAEMLYEMSLMKLGIE